MSFIDVIATINLWFGAICTIIITFITIIFSSVTKLLIYGDVEFESLCYGPELALAAISLDIFAISVYPSLFTFPRYTMVDPSKLWITIILLHILIYFFIAYFGHKGSTYNYIISGKSIPRISSAIYTQVSNVMGILTILSSILSIKNAI